MLVKTYSNQYYDIPLLLRAERVASYSEHSVIIFVDAIHTISSSSPYYIESKLEDVTDRTSDTYDQWYIQIHTDV